MPTIIKPDREASVDGKDLASELHLLMMSSITYRGDCGATFDIQSAYLRHRGKNIDWPNSLPGYQIKPIPPATDKPCGCEGDEHCDLCDESLAEICTTEDVMEAMDNVSPFRQVARLISTIKAYDYTSLVEHAYAKTGNKPFKLKSNKEITINEEEMNELAGLLSANIEAYIEQNDIRIDEIPYAFDFNAMSELVGAFEDYLLKKAKKHNDDEVQRYEESLERTFNRTNFMEQYIECIKDTANFPLGILWIDDNAIKKEKRISNGKVKIERKIQASAERVHPAHIWFTPDYSFSEVGRAVFRAKRFTHGDIMRWKNMGIAGSKKIESNITKFLEKYNEGCFIPYIMLFRNVNPLINYDYDVMIMRGMVKRHQVEELGVEIPATLKDENFIPCEIYFSGAYILRCRVMDVLDRHLGVYTTVFRRNCDSIYGYSVYDFCMPFASLYMNTMDAIDRSVGKSVGMFIQIDRAVIDDPDKYFKRDAKGNIILDITEDQLIEFDSNQAFGAPNFKGIPINITQVPSNLDKLMPMLELVIQEMERITKIPNLLTDGSDVSSALRTTSNMNMAYNSSAKVIQALLREAENRVLRPGIAYLFDCELMNERVHPGLLELEPEILLSDTLVRETNDAAELVQGLQVLSPYMQIIPPEKFATLLNTVARKAFGFTEDIMPDAGVFNVDRNPQEQTVV